METSTEDDGPLNVAYQNDDSAINLEKKDNITLINTNTQSLCPKMESLIECFEELSVDIAIVTETWFRTDSDP